jgi:hypothetical protein
LPFVVSRLVLRTAKMTTAAAYDVWLEEVKQALASINMPMEEWQKAWVFDFQGEFRSGTGVNDAALKANQF